VVVNEFGELGIDSALLTDCAAASSWRCRAAASAAAIGDLEATLEGDPRRGRAPRLVIEPTGLARPSDIVDLLRRARFAPRFDVRPVITLLDPRLGYAEEYAKGGLFRDQVDIGDFLVWNRSDLAAEDQLVAAEAWASALRPEKLGVFRTSFGVLPDVVLDTPLPRGREVEGATHSHKHAHESHEGYTGRGWAKGEERVFDAERLGTLFEKLKTGSPGGSPGTGSLGLSGRVARAKGIFRTTLGWRVHEIAGGEASIADTAYRRDNRVDVILEGAKESDFVRIAAALDDAVLPDGAPLLQIEAADGTLFRAFDASRLGELLRGREAVPLDELLIVGNAPADPAWLWLVSEGGLFGAGGPREVLTRGAVRLVDDPEQPFLYELADGAAGGAEADFETCREVPGLCAVRVSEPPGGGAGDEVPGPGSPDSR
jgi:G3E family GTPase